MILCGTALALTVGWTVPGEAASYRKHKKHYARNGATAAYAARRDDGTTPDWHPHDSKALPFGSRLWWQQKERESGGSSRQ